MLPPGDRNRQLNSPHWKKVAQFVGKVAKTVAKPKNAKSLTSELHLKHQHNTIFETSCLVENVKKCFKKNLSKIVSLLGQFFFSKTQK
jgi:hypothetical protein